MDGILIFYFRGKFLVDEFFLFFLEISVFKVLDSICFYIIILCV